MTIFAPWWAAAICIFIMTMLIGRYGEILIFALVLDSMYAVSTSALATSVFLPLGGRLLFTTCAIIILIVVEYIRRVTFTVQ